MSATPPVAEAAPEEPKIARRKESKEGGAGGSAGWFTYLALGLVVLMWVIPTVGIVLTSFRTRDDAAALRQDVVREGALAVVGGGFLGCEAAASARRLGAEVDLVELLAGHEPDLAKDAGEPGGHAVADGRIAAPQCQELVGESLCLVAPEPLDSETSSVPVTRTRPSSPRAAAARASARSTLRRGSRRAL